MFDAYIYNNVLIIPVGTGSTSKQIDVKHYKDIQSNLKELRIKFNNIFELLKNECDEYDKTLYDRIIKTLSKINTKIEAEIEQKKRLNNLI